jgi:predicted lipoprotein with Yx(FWY)xxD motif
MPLGRLALLLAAAGLAGTLAGPPAAMAEATGSSASGTLIRIIDHSRYGPMLFDGRGQAIYGFTYDRRNRSRCYGACARAWPPVYTRGAPRAGRNIRRSLLGTTRRRDGRRQVTYNGHPLYFYANEGRRQVFCQRVFSFGGLWLVVRPSGRLLR